MDVDQETAPAWVRHVLHGKLTAILLLVALAPAYPTKTPGELHQENAIRAITKAFDEYPIVAIGEIHRNQQVHDFIVSLLRDPGLQEKLGDIVVEFGNVRYQDLIDRYSTGGAISLDELRHVWRETVRNLVWDAPVYERFFATVRDVNQSLHKDKRLRILLADPPIDWREIQSREEWLRFAQQRDEHFAAVIEKEVLAKSRKALLIFGAGHLFHESAFVSRRGRKPVLADVLEEKHPGATLLIFSGDFDGAISDHARRFESWPKASLARLKGTWLGAVKVGDKSAKLEEVVDAFLYLGPVKSLTESEPSLDIYRDQAYLRELLRRDGIQGGYDARELEELKRKLEKN